MTTPRDLIAEKKRKLDSDISWAKHLAGASFALMTFCIVMVVVVATDPQNSAVERSSWLIVFAVPGVILAYPVAHYAAQYVRLLFERYSLKL